MDPQRSAFAPQAILWASLVVALFCVAIAFFLNRRTSRSKGTDLLLVGAPDAGKTALFTALVYNQSLPSLTSMQTNSSVYALSPSKAFRVIDIPGHPRIRPQVQEHLPSAKAIAFVVDASTISRNGAAVAEHLHTILHAITSLPPSQSLPSLLIVPHKADLLKAGSSVNPNEPLAITRVKTILERELEKRRASQSGGVGIEGLGAEDEKTEMGGLDCRNGANGFKFNDWEGGEVAFISSYVRSAKSNTDEEKLNVDDGLSDLRSWLADNM